MKEYISLFAAALGGLLGVLLGLVITKKAEEAAYIPEEPIDEND